MTTRIYVVKNADNKARLIRASTKAGAITHAAKTDYSAAVADQDELVSLTKDGVVVEVAGDTNAA